MTGTSAGFSAQVHRGSRRGRRFQWDDSRRTKQAQVGVVWGRGQAILDRVNPSSFARTALSFTAAAEDKQVPTENKIKRCRGTQQRVALGGRCGRRQPMVPRLPRQHGRKPIRRPTPSSVQATERCRNGEVWRSASRLFSPPKYSPSRFASRVGVLGSLRTRSLLVRGPVRASMLGDTVERLFLDLRGVVVRRPAPHAHVVSAQ
jgi:hypothetical protein